MKKIIMLSIVAIILFISLPSFAGWGNYYVKAAGPLFVHYLTEDSEIMSIRLESLDGSSYYYFRLDPTKENELLATALSALSTGKPVAAQIIKKTSYGSSGDFQVTSLYLFDSVNDLP